MYGVLVQQASRLCSSLPTQLSKLNRSLLTHSRRLWLLMSWSTSNHSEGKCLGIETRSAICTKSSWSLVMIELLSLLKKLLLEWTTHIILMPSLQLLLLQVKSTVTGLSFKRSRRIQQLLSSTLVQRRPLKQSKKLLFQKMKIYCNKSQNHHSKKSLMMRRRNKELRSDLYYI